MRDAFNPGPRPVVRIRRYMSKADYRANTDDDAGDPRAHLRRYQQRLRQALEALPPDKKRYSENGRFARYSFAGSLQRVTNVLGWSNEDLAKRTGISISEVGLVWYGSPDPRLHVLEKIARVLLEQTEPSEDYVMFNPND